MLQRLYISTEEYFALPHASNSGVKEAHKLMNNKDTTRVETRAYMFGSALDNLLTDPTIIDTQGLTSEEHALLNPMRRAIDKNPTYIALFKYAERQAVFTESHMPVNFDGLETTILGKCKLDWWPPKLRIPGDLKTTEARTWEQFKSAAKWFDYDQQAAWYMDVTNTDRFVIIACSKWNYATWEISYKRGDAAYQEGKKKYLRDSASWWKLYGHTQKPNNDNSMATV